jgi:hypothetical protein
VKTDLEINESGRHKFLSSGFWAIQKKKPTSLRVSELFKLALIWRLDYWAAAAHPLTFFIHNKN